MRLCKDLINKPIYTISDGRNIGDAKDLYLSADLETMAGIHLGREGLVRRKSILIPIDAVVVFGIDAILVKSDDVVTDNKALSDSASWVRLDDVIGRGVDTPGGTKVGVIGDVVLDEDGSVAGFVLSKVYVEGPISEKRLISHDAIIDNGNVDGVMTVEIARAEAPELAVAPAEKAPPEKMPDEIEPPKAADALPESDPVIEAEVEVEAEVESAEMDTSVMEQDLPPTADA